MYEEPVKVGWWLGWNYFFVCVVFAFTQALASTTVALAYAFAGSLGSTSAGIVFGTYTLCALLVSTSVIDQIGPRNSLSVGSALVALFVSSYAVLPLSPTVRTAVIISGSIAGGVGTGIMWTAQGAYMTVLIKCHSDRHGADYVETSSWAAGFFATVALGIEVLVKAAASPIDQHMGQYLFVVLGGMSCVAAVCMMIVMCLGRVSSKATTENIQGQINQSGKPQREDDDPEGGLCSRAMAGIRLFRSDVRVLLLAPFNLSFGFILAFMNYYVSGVLATEAFGKEKIGEIVSIKPAVACILSLVYSRIFITRTGKLVLLLFASVNYIAMAAICVAIPQSQLMRSKYVILLLYVIAGSGRAAFEGANKSLIADFFKHDAPAAFANVIFQSGLGSTIGFLAFPFISVRLMLVLMLCTSAVSVIGLIMSYHQRFKQDGIGDDYQRAHNYSYIRSDIGVDSDFDGDNGDR